MLLCEIPHILIPHLWGEGTLGVISVDNARQNCTNALSSTVFIILSHCTPAQKTLFSTLKATPYRFYCSVKWNTWTTLVCFSIAAQKRFPLFPRRTVLRTQIPVFSLRCFMSCTMKVGGGGNLTQHTNTPGSTWPQTRDCLKCSVFTFQSFPALHSENI